MGDNNSDYVPLIPGKNNVCGDVRALLRRALPLPPAAPAHSAPHPAAPVAPGPRPAQHPAAPGLRPGHGNEPSASVYLAAGECLRNARAHDVAGSPLPARCRCGLGRCACHLIRAGDVLPGGDTAKGALWLKAAQTHDDEGEIKPEESTQEFASSVQPSHVLKEDSVQSLSIGPRRQTCGWGVHPSLVSSHKEATGTIAGPIICLPPHIEFINCQPGNRYSRSVRLVNRGRGEVRLAVRPPARSELNVELSARGLRLTAGAALELTIHFTPVDVRPFNDVLTLLVKDALPLLVPISCVTESPQLHVLSGCQCKVQLEATCSDVLDLGARLLGDVHSMPLEFHCSARHARFYIMSEEAWISWCVYEGDVVAAGAMRLWPARYAGGGRTQGRVWCRASSSGLQVASLIVLSSNAVMRPLYVIADSLMYSPNHVFIKCREKDYDILSEDDPSCQGYVHLGTLAPGRNFKGNLAVENCSVLKYSYFLRVRQWDGPENRETDECDTLALSVRPLEGTLEPRSYVILQLMTNGGTAPGEHRAVVQLLLQNIPRESIPLDLEHTIVGEDTVEAEEIPGMKIWTRKLCCVLVEEVEVWWEVQPPRIFVEPIYLPLIHSRRVKSVEINVRATLLGTKAEKAEWKRPDGTVVPVLLSPLEPSSQTITVPLPPHEGTNSDVVTCATTDGEYFASMHIERRSEQRHPRLNPTTTWIGVLPPGSDVTASLKAYNDTFEQIYFRAQYIHWTESKEDDSIECPEVRCSVCHQRSCRCTMLLPTAGRMPIGSSKQLKFHTSAGTTAGADLWLVSLQRCIADSAYPLQEAPINGLAALIGARIVAPQLSLHVEAAPLQKALITKCSAGDVCHCCLPEPLILDGDVSAGLVRPTEPLVQGRIVYCRLKVINLTPIPTRLHWESDPDKDNPVKVTFKPNEVDITGYGQAEIEVELLGSRVSPRRLFSLCGLVEHGEPVYLLVDAAVDGQSISLELPNARVIYRSEVSVPNPKKSKPPQMVQSEDNILTLEAIFAKRYPDLMGLSEPDKCSCEPYCECPPVIEFRMVPLHKEMQQIIRLHNTGVLCVSWSIKPYLLEMDGVAALRVWATPSQGVLAGRSSVGIRVHVCCKRAGARKALLTLKTSEIVLPFHVWVQANGPPLKLLAAFEEEHTLWMSETQLVRTLRARNIYGTQLKVETYIIRDYEYVQSQLPFRLFYQLFDIPVTVERCPCMKVQYQGYEASGEVTPIPSQCSSHSSLYSTGVRLYLGPDVGVQDYTYFEVTPDKTTVPIDSTESWAVRLKENDMVTPPHTLLLRAIAVGYDVEGWEGLLMVHLKVTPRQPKLQIDPDSVELRFSALNLPSNDVMRLRKSIRIQNTGTGELRLSLHTSGSWLLKLGRSITRDRECSCNTGAMDELMVTIAPRTAIEVKVQIEVDTSEAWPSPCPGLCDCAAQAPPAACYPDKKWVSGELVLHGNHGVFQVVPLSLELHYPVLTLRPKSLDLGAVLAGESRKTYLTLRHTARDAVAVVMRWEGDPGFSVHPQRLHLEAGTTTNIYVLFTAPDTSTGPAAGVLRARVASDAGAWCQDTAELKAEVTRDAAAHRPPHDYTDDPSLLPQRARQGL